MCAMAEMHDAVQKKIEQIRAFHTRQKAKSYGWLVRPTTLIIGWFVFILGILIIPFPGPGWLTAFLGIGFLSLELLWARRLLDWGVRQYEKFFAWFNARTKTTRVLLTVGLSLLVFAILAAIAFGMWQRGSLDFIPYLPTPAEFGL